MDTDTTKQAILERCHDILVRWGNAMQAAELAEKQKAVISAEYADCQAAARLFGFDLTTEYSAYTSQLIEQQNDQHSLSVGLAGAAATASVQRLSAVPIVKQKTIREFVLDAAEAAFPNPVRAKRLKKFWEEQTGIEVHDKTVGMTLYRLSKENLVQRDGKADWYFVPEEERVEKFMKAFNEG